MLRNTRFFIIFIFLAGFLFFSSCSDPAPTKGSLTITVMKYDGTPLSGILIYLSRSYQDLQNRSYIDSAWTNAYGYFHFSEKEPGYYWYDTKDWEDYGAAKVLNGIDTFVILWVNTPDTLK